ncbi:MAG TPA: 16S rRNA (adenine(1518)-N(6)/adenine(1519)-N(6))-dimethyltransferase RsmA [Candidatus Atribacteria bacterium]|nr:16S rRNA (adenine(1518)-N(6)/adenine(1519)-N(6))-dimethyltransferase RsmA [Candidatus Atribacteria bacterium]
MNKLNLTSPTEVTRLLTKYDFKCKKRLGQNFLVDQNTLQIIINSLQLNKEDRILEIGTGIGTLTSALSPLVNQVISVEKDKRLTPLLEESLSSFNNIEIIFEDIMKFDLANFFEQKREKGENIEKIVGNLPYYISIPLISQILELNRYLRLAVFLVQKEVGERLMAKPGGKDYGILSLVAQYYSKPQKVHIVPSTVFYPQPKVSSMIIKLDIYKKPQVQAGSEKLFFNIIRASFQQRRKRLINSLSNYFKGEIAKTEIENILTEVSIDKNRRGETLTLEEFAKLSTAMGNKLL